MSTFRRLAVPALLALASFAVCLFVLVSPAPAADKGGPKLASEDYLPISPDKPWTAFYGSLGVSTGALTSDFGFGVDGYGIAARAGFDAQINRMVLGVLADYQWDNVNAGGSSVSAKEWGGAGRIGFLPADNVLVYGLVGEKWLSVSGMNTQGLWTGGGLEVALTKHWRLGVEYGHIVWDDIPAAREQTVTGRLIFALPVAGLR